jgi:hypothetical protein
MVNKKWPEKLTIHVSRAHIAEGECRQPTKCMIRLAVKHAIGGHGYVKVDATGIAITRRDDYREKFHWPSARHKAVRAMIAFDKKEPVEPFTFVAKFQRTTKIVKRDTVQVNRWRDARKAAGRPDKRSDMKKRIIGLAA